MAKSCCFKQDPLFMRSWAFVSSYHYHYLRALVCLPPLLQLSSRRRRHFIIFAEAMDRQLMLFACFLLLVSSTQAIGVKYCDKKKNYAVTIQQVKIIPDPVVTGKPATFNISAVTDVEPLLVYTSSVARFWFNLHNQPADPACLVAGLDHGFLYEAVDCLSSDFGQAVYGGKVVINVAYFGVPVHQETRDVCEEVSCPIAAGDFVLSHTQTLPSFTPPGSYTLKMTMEDKNNEELTCFSFNFKIGFHSLVSDS
ncbi:hypothetical protein WN943_025842 [Citrus x changshan-huyou]